MLKKLLEKRQSVRIYEQTPVPEEKIKECVEAARLAPSACNSQPWHFIIINDPVIKNNFCDRVFSGPYCMNIFAKKSPVIIACVAEKTSLLLKTAGFFRQAPSYLIDMGIAVEHFVLQAEALGLATCWIGWFNENWAKRILHVPGNRKIACLLTLGYSKEERREKTRKNLEDIYSFNHY